MDGNLWFSWAGWWSEVEGLDIGSTRGFVVKQFLLRTVDFSVLYRWMVMESRASSLHLPRKNPCIPLKCG
jgi:hypothetical protein